MFYDQDLRLSHAAVVCQMAREYRLVFLIPKQYINMDFFFQIDEKIVETKWHEMPWEKLKH